MTFSQSDFLLLVCFTFKHKTSIAHCLDNPHAFQVDDYLATLTPTNTVTLMVDGFRPKGAKYPEVVSVALATSAESAMVIQLFVDDFTSMTTMNLEISVINNQNNTGTIPLPG